MEIDEAIEIALKKIKQIPNLQLRQLGCLVRLKVQKRRGQVDETVYSVDDQGNQEVDHYVMKHLMETKSCKLVAKTKARLFIQLVKENLSCEKCAEKHPACLDFHHIDPETKEFSIAQMQGIGKSVELIVIEMKKCIVFCSNCHRKEHYSTLKIE